MKASQAMTHSGALLKFQVGQAVLRTLTFLMVVGAISASDQVQAQRSKIDAFLQRWDADHDGTLGLDEIKKAASARFEELDRKHRGTLTRNQLAGMVSFQQFRRADSHKSGTVDESEFLSLAEKLFQDADKDHDGTLDGKELGRSAGRALLGLFAIRQGPVI